MTDNFIMPFSGGELDHVETQRSAEELPLRSYKNLWLIPKRGLFAFIKVRLP